MTAYESLSSKVDNSDDCKNFLNAIGKNRNNIASNKDITSTDKK